MKKRILAFFAGITALALSLASCTAALAEQVYPDCTASAETSRLRIHIAGSAGTRSSISPDEDRINSVCVMAYREADGTLAAARSATSEKEIDMELTCGRYDIYITANMEGFQAPATEKEISSVCHAVESFAQMGEALPMCWKGKAELTPGKGTTVRAELSRLVSKTGLRIDLGSIKGLDIRSVRLCQGTPFCFIASFAFVLRRCKQRGHRAKPIPLVGRCLGAAVV